MNKIHFHGVVRTLLFAVTILLFTIVGTSCSSDDDQSYLYSIGVSSMAVEGLSYLSALKEAEGQFESSFTLTGSPEACDEQAIAKFATAITILRKSAAKITDCNGYVLYVLSRSGETLASEQIDFVETPQ